MSQDAYRSNLIAIVVATIGIMGTIIAAVIVAISNRDIERERQVFELTRIALVSMATQGAATQAVMASTIAAPAAGATALPIGVASTPTAPPPTPTAPPPTLPPGSFIDNFDSGVLQPGWEGAVDRFRVADGMLTVKYPNSRDTIYISSISSANYSVDFDMRRFPGDCWYAGNGWNKCNDYQELFVFARYEDSEHYSVAKFPFNNARDGVVFTVYWDLLGARSGSSSGGVGLPQKKGRAEFDGHVCMELSGTKYTMLFNGKPLLAFDDGTDSLHQGKIVLTMEWKDTGDLRPSGGLDNFRVIPEGKCALP